MKFVMKVFLAALLAGILVQGVYAEDPYVFLTKWGTWGSGDGQFKSPRGVTVDSEDNVYVADTGNHRIQKFDSNGGFLTKWGTWGSGDGLFIYPYDTAVDSAGNVYVADYGNHRIQKFDSSGTFLTKWGSSGTGDGKFIYPEGIAVDSEDNVYVADTVNNRIQRFDSNGEFLTKWGSSGTGDGQFYSPRGIAIDSAGNVYVADNSRIQKFDSSGNFLIKLGSFNAPKGVAVDSAGNVFVADTWNYRIQKFNSTGTLLTTWGTWGSDNGNFYDPYGITVDSTGNVSVADWGFDRIQKFGPISSPPEANTAPVAEAGPDQSITVLGSIINLDGTMSHDDDGDSFTYLWTIDSKPWESAAALSDITSPTPSFTADVQGEYVITLVVTDLHEAKSTPDSVTVSFSNVKPVADAGDSQEVSAGTIVSLDGSGSNDTNGDPLTYLWSIVSKPEGSGAELSTPSHVQPTFTADSAGTYEIKLVVNDSFIDSDPSTVIVIATITPSDSTKKAKDTINAINSLDDANFKNPNMKNALINKVTAVIQMVEQGQYAESLKLQKDILQKMDGCDQTGAPDKNDWIEDCDAQQEIRSILNVLIENMP